MSLPGVKLNVLNGNLGLQAASAEQSMIYLGCSVGGVQGTLKYYGDVQALESDLVAGEVLEAAAYNLAVSGGVVGVYSMPPTDNGAIGAVTHTGTGTTAMTASSYPQSTVILTITTSGALGTGKFTYQVGSGSVSQPVLLPTGHDYLIPGTYCIFTWPTHTYAATEFYTINPSGSIAYNANGSGGSTASPTLSSSPIDAFNPLITVTLGGALGTAQFVYSLDGSADNTSAPVLTAGSGSYALPGTGVAINFGGSLTLGDTYSFGCAPPSYTNSDLAAACTALQTTYLSSAQYSMATAIGNLPLATDWVTQVGTLNTCSAALFNLGVFMRFFSGCPTLGSVMSVLVTGTYTYTVDITDTDSVVEAQRLNVSTSKVIGCAGDEDLVSVISGLTFRRNCSWVASTRAASVEASENIGAVADGALPGVTKIYRNEQATPALDAIGFVTLRTFAGNLSSGTGLAGFYITDGHTLDSVTSDYYPLANARVIDRGCTIARAAALPLVNSKIPTTTRGVNVGVITEARAQQIDSMITNALTTGMVNTSPQDAVAAKAVTSRTHDILADGNLIIQIGIQPFAYAHTITENIGLATSV